MKFIHTSLLLILLSAGVSGQSNIIQRSMAAHQSWKSVKSLSYKTEGVNHNKWQNYDFANPQPTRDEAERYFDFSSVQYHIKTISRYAGGYVFEFINIGKDSSRYTYDKLKSRNGKVYQKTGKKDFEAGLNSTRETFPYYLIRQVEDNTSASFVKNDTTIEYRLGQNITEIVFSTKGFVLEVTQMQNGRRITRKFSDYTTADGVLYPSTCSLYNNGELIRIDKVVRFSINETLNSRLLEIPAEYRPLASPPPSMAVSVLTPGVYLIENVPGGRNVLFVDLPDGILVTEAPLSVDVCKGIIQAIRKTLPGRPIRYVHLSHFHNDHSHGIAAFLDEGAQLIATPNTIEALQTYIPEKNNIPANFISFSGVFDLGTDELKVRLFEVPTNTHARGLSFLYIPSDGIIYQGDLFSLPDDKTITPAIEVTKIFYEFLRSNKISFKRMVGHHGASNITQEDLLKAITLEK